MPANATDSVLFLNEYLFSERVQTHKIALNIIRMNLIRTNSLITRNALELVRCDLLLLFDGFTFIRSQFHE